MSEINREPMRSEPVVVNFSLGQADTLGFRPRGNGAWRMAAATVAVGALVFVGGKNSAEGSRLNDISNTMSEFTEGVYGQFIDPPVEDNPACVLVDPVQIEGIMLDASQMPLPCGELLPFSDTEVLYPDDTIHLGINIENPINDEAFSSLYDQNPSTARDIFPQLMELNTATGMINELNSAGLCAEAISKILEGIEDTRHSEDPLGLGEERNVSVKLFEKQGGNEWQELALECE